MKLSAHFSLEEFIISSKALSMGEGLSHGDQPRRYSGHRRLEI